MKTKFFSRKTAISILLISSLMLFSTACGAETPTEAENTTESTEVSSEETQVTTEVVEESEADVTEEASGDVSMYDGIFTYVIMNEGTEYINYLNFYENGVYYYSKYNDGQYQAGYYEVIEETFEIESFGNVSGTSESEMKTCDAKIVFYEMDGKTVAAEAGYQAQEQLIVGFTLQDGRDFGQDLTTGHTSDDETGVNMAEFYLENDEYSLVAIKHNGTFQDTISTYISGTWTKDGNTYNLLNESTGTTYSVTDNEDGTATYVNEEAAEMTLYAVQEAEAGLVLAGTGEGAYGELSVSFTCYSDDTAILQVLYAGTETVVNGTWAMAADYSNITFNMEDGTEFVAPMNYETQTFSMEYQGNDGVSDIVIVLNQ